MSIAVATAEEVDKLRDLVTQLAADVAALKASGGTTREFMTIGETAKHFRIRRSKVDDALSSGRLKGERVKCGRSPDRWRITLADAKRWFQRFDRGTSNQ